MCITEELLLEATFKNPTNLQKHYDKHVLNQEKSSIQMIQNFPIWT